MSKVKLFGKREKDMTQGNIWILLLKFAAPLALGYVFQQLYNVVDTYVVGNFVGTEAYAAVGNIGPIINMLIGLFMGLATGAGVVLSQYYGAGDYDKVGKVVHTLIALALVMAVVLSLAGIALIEPMLSFMKIKEPKVHAEAKIYLTIYFAGSAGLMFYNAGAGVLRAIGDSTRPFVFLVITALLNTGLDLLFVLAFDMGVAGVAWATVIAQAISAILVLITLTRSKGPYKLCWGKVGFSLPILRQVIKVGMPSALQQAVTSFSNVFVQAYINAFGASLMAGWTTYGKLDAFALVPMMSIGMASTTFVGQNLGAGNVDRAKKGVRISLGISLICTAMLLAPLMIWTRPLAAIFNPDPAVVDYAVLIIRLLSPFYLCCCINQIYSGALRGAGASFVAMAIMLSSFVVFRQIYLAVVSSLTTSVLWTIFSYPLGWILASTLSFLYFRSGKWERFKLTKAQVKV